MSWQIRRLDSNQVWSLVPGVDLSIGRAADVALHLPDPTVSGRQAVIDWQGDRPRLTNLSQTNPTVLDGQPVGEAVPLRPGATIYCGSIALRVEQIAGASAVPAPAPARRRGRWPLFAGLGAALSVCLCATIVAGALLVPGLANAPATPGLGSPTTAGNPATPTATARPLTPAEQTLKALNDTYVRGRNSYRDAQTLSTTCGRPIDQLTTFPRLNVDVGHKQTFFVGLDRPAQRPATLQFKTDHVYLYVEDGVRADPNQSRDLAQRFESDVYAQARNNFGPEWPDELDDDKHVTIYVGTIGNARGYFSPGDLQSRALNATSNERRIIYVSAEVLADEGVQSLLGTMAHEFTHMIQQNVDASRFPRRPGSEERVGGSQDGWIQEGAAELSKRLADPGGTKFREDLVFSQSDVQLDGWESDPNQRANTYYGVGNMFLTYLGERLGGMNMLREVTMTPGRGPQMIDNYFRNKKSDQTFNAVVRDWMLANLINDRSVMDGRYGYQSIQGNRKADKTLTGPAQDAVAIRHYAPRYLELKPATPGTYSVHFQGNPQTKIVPPDLPNGAMWWGNRGDNHDTTLTRTIDLTNVPRATLNARLWYSLVGGSFAMAQVSTDDGCSWQVLRTSNTRNADSLFVENRPFYVYTGGSGSNTRDGSDAAWIDEQIDLTPFAGKKIQFRFQHLNFFYDASPGFVVGEMSIPELNFRDDLTSDNGWQAEGFVRVLNQLNEQWGVRLVKYQRGGTVSVEEMALDANQNGMLTIPDLGGQTERAVLVFAALTPYTTVRAQYQVNFTSA